MSNLEFFKNEAKKFLKDWQTQSTTTNSDGSISYHYDWKFYNLDYYFNLYKLNDKDRQEIMLARAQHYISKIVGCKNWNELITLPETELEKSEQLLRNHKNDGKQRNKDTNKQFIPYFRIRSSSEMTPKDLAQFRAALNKIIPIIKRSISDKDFWEDHFWRWDTPDDTGKTYADDERREYLEQQLKERTISFAKTVTKAYKKFCNGRPYVGCYSPVVITQLIGQLGIQVFKVNLGTDKISGFCTRLFDIDEDSEIKKPIIVINELSCNTPEKYLMEEAKLFYYMISKPDDFNFENEIKTEIYSNEAEKFAKELFIPIRALDYYLEHYSLVGALFHSDLTKDDKELFFEQYEFERFVNEIKHDFRVSYKTALKKLWESNWTYKIMFNSYEEIESFYFKCLKRHDENYADKISYLNGEPAPLPWKIIGFDASERYR